MANNELDFKEQDVVIWIGLIWLRIDGSVGLL